MPLLLTGGLALQLGAVLLLLFPSLLRKSPGRPALPGRLFLSGVCAVCLYALHDADFVLAAGQLLLICVWPAASARIRDSRAAAPAGGTRP